MSSSIEWLNAHWILKSIEILTTEYNKLAKEHGLNPMIYNSVYSAMYDNAEDKESSGCASSEEKPLCNHEYDNLSSQCNKCWYVKSIPC